MRTLLLSQNDTRRVATMHMALQSTEKAFAAYGRGEAIMPPKVYLTLDHHEGDFRAMPAYMNGAAGVKWVNAHPDNPSKHRLPAVMGMYLLNDPSTAVPLAVMDATLLTALRTGASAGVATRYLAAPDPKTLGIVGCGVQARYLVEAVRLVHPNLEVCVTDLSRSAAERFAGEVQGNAVDIAQAAGCDIVCTATPSRRPVVERSWIKKGAHINAMGADAEGKQELDPEILKDAWVFVDDMEQASHSGEINVPLREGQLTKEDIRGQLGDVVSGHRTFRRDARLTVFDSTGLAVQDVSLARAIYEAARDQGVGTMFEFM